MQSYCVIYVFIYIGKQTVLFCHATNMVNNKHVFLNASELFQFKRSSKNVWGQKVRFSSEEKRTRSGPDNPDSLSAGWMGPEWENHRKNGEINQFVSGIYCDWNYLK